MRYMVMECRPGYAVVLGEDGRFLKVANLRYKVGQTVSHVIQMETPQAPALRTNRRWLSVLTTLAACLVLVMTSVFLTGQAPYASVYLTINPEVRIDVNRKDVVVGVEGMNTDGTDLLAGYEYRRKELPLVMDELVDRAIDRGYLHEGGKVTLTLDAEENWVVSHEAALADHLTQYLTEKISVTVDVTPAETTQSSEPDISGGQTVVIPLEPADSYSDSAYGQAPPGDDRASVDTADGDTPYEDRGPTEPAVVIPDDDGASGDTASATGGDSGYDGPEHGQLPEPPNSGQSEYGGSPYEEEWDDEE